MPRDSFSVSGRASPPLLPEAKAPMIDYIRASGGRLAEQRALMPKYMRQYADFICFKKIFLEKSATKLTMAIVIKASADAMHAFSRDAFDVN